MVFDQGLLAASAAMPGATWQNLLRIAVPATIRSKFRDKTWAALSAAYRPRVHKVAVATFLMQLPAAMIITVPAHRGRMRQRAQGRTAKVLTPPLPAVFPEVCTGKVHLAPRTPRRIANMMLIFMLNVMVMLRRHLTNLLPHRRTHLLPHLALCVRGHTPRYPQRKAQAG